MNTRGKIAMVIFFFLFCSTVFGQSSDCSDNFGWMETSSSSPNDSACRTWNSTTDTAYDWTAVWDGETQQAEYFLQSPLVRSHNELTVGGDYEFEVSDLTLVEFQLSLALELKRHCFIVRASTDHRATWSEVKSQGGVLSPDYSQTMSISTSLEAPPLGLRGIRAYTGSMTNKTRIRLDLRSSTYVGQTIQLQLYFVSDNSVGVEGVHLYSFNYWNAPLEPPTRVDGVADNSSYVVNYELEEDPRVAQTQVWDNGVLLGNLTSPFQVTNLTNGVPHTVEVRNLDTYGNVAGLTSVPSPLIPGCTGVPPMTLLLMNAGGGSWVPQTAEVPCGSGVGPVDGYSVYRSAWAEGPWELIASKGPAGTEFFDSDPLPGTDIYFYRVLSTKNGVEEGSNPPD